MKQGIFGGLLVFKFGFVAEWSSLGFENASLDTIVLSMFPRGVSLTANGLKLASYSGGMAKGIATYGDRHASDISVPRSELFYADFCAHPGSLMSQIPANNTSKK